MSAVRATAAAPVAAPASTVAPFALVRVAAVPYERLLDLTPPRSAALVDEVLAGTAQLESLRQALIDPLTAAVQAAPDRQLRTLALALKRDVFNGRCVATAPASLERLSALLPASASDTLREWDRLARALLAAANALEECADDELRSHCRSRLVAATKTEPLAAALKLASPALCDALPGLTADKRSTKIDRTLFGYVMRSAAKTSPFAGFMHTGLATFATTAVTTSLRRVTQLRVNRALLTEALTVGGWLPRLATEVVRNRTLRFVSPQLVSAVVSRYVWNQGLMWRNERVATCRFHEAVVARLRALPARLPLAELVTALSEVGFAQPQAQEFARRLVTAGFWEAPLPFDVRSPDALADCLRAAQAADAPAPLRRSLARLAELQARRGDDDRERVQATDAELRAIKGGDGPPATALEGRNPLVEDGLIEGACAPLGPTQRRALESVARVLRRRLALQPDYVSLTRHFVRRFGPSGVTDDVYGFLTEAATYLSAWQEDDSQGDKRRSDVVPTGRVPATVFCQLDEADPATGQPRAVVNNVFVGAASVTARFAGGDSSLALALRGRLRDWFDELALDGDELLEAPMCAECSELQMHPALTKRTLAWPGETLHEADASLVPLAALKLAHDADSGLLQLRDGDDRVVRGLYVGSVTMGAIYGERYLFRLLGSPFRIAPPPRLTVPSLPYARPRLEEDGVILMRARWWIPAAELLRELRGSSAHKLIRLAQKCRTWNVPRYVFATRAGQSDKPLWLDLRNLLCVELLEKLAEGVESVVLTEVFPLPHGNAAGPEEARYATELQVEMAL